MPQLVLATHNKGKLREFAALLGFPAGYMVTAGELGLPEPEETGASFAENALIKARAAHQATGHAALSDDSGLCVSALHGEPGIYSARWAGPNKDFLHAMRRVHDAIGQLPDRSATFIATLALVLKDGSEHLFEGRVEGEILWPPRGSNGHGYDPIFMPKGEKRTFGEMDESEKNAISHRGRAIRLLQEWLAKNPLP